MLFPLLVDLFKVNANRVGRVFFRDDEEVKEEEEGSDNEAVSEINCNP